MVTPGHPSSVFPTPKKNQFSLIPKPFKMKLIFTTFRKRALLTISLIVIIVLSAKQSAGQVCSDPTNVIYALSNSGNIVPVTVGNATVGAAINPAYTSAASGANAAGYNSVNGKFYYFQNNSSSSQVFISFNPANNQYAALANSPITAPVNRGCVSFNGTGYYCLDQSGNLCYYNIASNSWVLITSVFTDQFGGNVTSVFQSQGSGDMAIDGLGNLWILSSNTSQYGLYKISAPLPTTAAAGITVTQFVAPTTATPAGVNFAGIAFSSTGQIYACTPNDLYIMGNNLALTHLGAFSVAGVGGDLTSCSFPISVLPVSWETFKATVQSAKTVLLNWTVAQQINNKGYFVEHSHDGTKWESIGYIENNGENTSATYSFTDAAPFIGKNYYRIQQEDLNGNNSYSDIQILDMELTEQVAIWPNPAKNIVNIQEQNNAGAYNINAEIFNQSGQRVSVSQLHSGINTVNINSLPSGYYIVHIDLSDGESYNQKIVKL